MGRQITFFATPTDYIPLIEHILKCGWYILNFEGKRVSLDEIKYVMQDSFDKGYVIYDYYATKEGSKIIINKYKVGDRVDSTFSEVIEISVCMLQRYLNGKELEEPNRYEHARFWYDRQYYDDKENIVVKSEELDKMFNSLVRQIKKNAKISKDNCHWYILPDAYRLYKKGKFIPCSAVSKIEF
jgi:hypothetical protein